MCETIASLGPPIGPVSLVSLTLASSQDVPLDDIDRVRTTGRPKPGGSLDGSAAVGSAGDMALVCQGKTARKAGHDALSVAGSDKHACLVDA